MTRRQRARERRAYNRIRRRGLPVIMQAPWLSPDEVKLVMIHETFHYLLECTGTYLGDPLHVEEGVWDELTEEALNDD